MIDYEVEAVLRVIDRASPDLRRVIGLSREAAASMERLDQVEMRGISALSLSGLEKNLRAISRAIPVIEKNLGGLGVAFDGAFGTAAVKIDAVAAAVERLNAGLGETAAAAEAAGISGAAGRGGAGGSGRGGAGGRRRGHLGLRHYSRIAPGIMSSGDLTPSLVGAIGIGYGLYSNAMLEDALVNIIFTMGAGRYLNAAQTANLHDKLRAIVQNASTETGSPSEEMAKAALVVARQMAGFKPEDRLKVMGPTLEFAAQEHRLKGVSYEEGAESILGIMHILQYYKPEVIKKLMSHIGYLSFVTPASLPQYASALSYVAPMVAGGLMKDKSIDNMLILLAAMQRAGIKQGKAGTWPANLLYGALAGSVTISGHAAGKQIDALKALGIVNNGKSTVLKDGNLDIILLGQKLAEAKERLASQPGKFELYAKQAFQLQGSRAAELVSSTKLLEMIAAIGKEMANAPSPESYFAVSGRDSPAQQARQTLAELVKTLQKIGETLTPIFLKALQGIDVSLKFIDSFLNEHFPTFKNLPPPKYTTYPSWWPTWLMDDPYQQMLREQSKAKPHKSSFVPGNDNAGGIQKISLNIDGRKMGEVVLARMSGSMRGPQAGYSGTDTRMQPIPVGASYAI